MRVCVFEILGGNKRADLLSAGHHIMDPGPLLRRSLAGPCGTSVIRPGDRELGGRLRESRGAHLRVGRQRCPFRIYHLARPRAVGCTVRLHLLVACKAKLVSPEIESHGVCVYMRATEVTRAIGRREGIGMLEALSHMPQG
jgi:hypothetical protein